MRLLRMMNVLLLLVVTGGSLARPAPARGQTAYDCSTATDLPQSECEALVAFYNATGGDDWYTRTGWLQTTTPCTWYGVTCTDGHVTQLSMFNNYVSGALPPEIGDLTALKRLELVGDRLPALPKIGNLTAGDRRVGRGDGGKLTSLPAEIGNLAALEWLDLGRNFLSILPAEIGNLTSLRELTLNLNDLKSVPPEIGNLATLELLNLDYNSVRVLPPEIGKLTALKELRLRWCGLVALPPEIGNLTALEWLNLSENRLTTLPAEIGSLTALRWLYIESSGLTELPAEIGNLAGLVELTLSGNALTTLPPEIGNLFYLTYLDVSSNALTAFPEGIGNLTVLEVLDLHGNALTVLPPEIANFSKLRSLHLSYNPLAALPLELGNFAVLQKLYLDYTLLSGEIPAFLTLLDDLEEFTFSETAWCVPSTGPVPEWLRTIRHVKDSGLVCEPATGSLQGVVTLPGGVPAAGIQVNLQGSVSNVPWWHYFTTTHTLADGAYRFDNLGPDINYYLQFVAPDVHYASEYYSNALSLEQATPVTVATGSTRSGIDVELAPSAAQIVKYSMPGYYVANDSLLTYTLVVSANVDTELTIYDPLGDHLTWQGFVGTVPGTLTYTTALTGSVTVSASKPLLVSFAVRVNVPDTSFVSQFAQVSNVAYCDFLGVTYPSNTHVNVVYRGTIPTIYLPLVMR